MQNPVIDVLDSKSKEDRAVEIVAPGDNVAEAVRRMNARRIGAVIVQDEGRTIGIFTERDVLMRVVAKGRDPESTVVRDVMTDKLYTVDPKTTVERAMAIITETRCRHLPVMEGSELKGMISIGDLTRWVVRHQRIHLEELQHYIAGTP